MTDFNIETATPSELDDFAMKYRISLNEKTVLLALRSISMFLDERNMRYVRSNLEDALAYASPRLKAMKTSIRRHLPYVTQLTVLQQKEELRSHFAAFCKGVNAQ